MLTLTTTIQVLCEIDGKLIKEFYAFDRNMTDAQIQSTVEADLAEKGYTW